MSLAGRETLPSTVLASRAVHPWALFRAKIDINKEIVHLVYMCGVNLSVMHCGPFFTRHLFSNKKFFMHHKYSAVKIQRRIRGKKWSEPESTQMLSCEYYRLL